LQQMLDTVKRRVYRYHYTSIRTPRHFEEYLTAHEGLLRACQKNDGDMAEKHMKLHIETLKEALLKYLENIPNVW